MSAGNRSTGQPAPGAGQIVKRPRAEDEQAAGASDGALVRGSKGQQPKVASAMEMTGHSGEVFAARFDPQGELIASGSMDKSIMLWRATGDCENYGVLTGHKGAVVDLQWSRDSGNIFSASADYTIAMWDADSGQRIRKYEGHEGYVNSVDRSKRSTELILSGGDDGTVGIWDTRSKAAVNYLETDYPITAVAMAEDGLQAYSGGVDSDIKAWDLRKNKVVYTLQGHTDLVTSLQVSPDGTTLLSNAHDSTVRTWNIRSFVSGSRQITAYDGAPTGMEKNLYKASWNKDGSMIAAGSGDRGVAIWESRTGKLLQMLYGHRGAVNDVRFSPAEDPSKHNLVLSASTDKTMMLGEAGT